MVLIQFKQEIGQAMHNCTNHLNQSKSRIPEATVSKFIFKTQ